MSEKLNTAIAGIGIDIGKNSFHVVGHDQRGAIVLHQKKGSESARGKVVARRAQRDRSKRDQRAVAAGGCSQGRRKSVRLTRAVGKKARAVSSSAAAGSVSAAPCF